MGGKVKRGSVTLPMVLLKRVDRIWQSKRFRYDSRADCTADALEKWLEKYEELLESLEKTHPNFRLAESEKNGKTQEEGSEPDTDTGQGD